MPKLHQKYIWTSHSEFKMRYYRLSESLIKRVIRFPARIEESIVPGTIACMRPANTKDYSEVWAMYKATRNNQIKIITAWRYPGKSPERDPIPAEIIEEVKQIIGT